MSKLVKPQTRLIFLDRDGVINYDRGYVGQVSEFEFIKPVFAVMQQFVNEGFLPVVVTNQSGIGRGYYSENAFHAVSQYMQQIFKHHQLPYVPVYYCPHHPTAAKSEYLQDCNCRKPAPGMLLQAAQDLHANLSHSVLLGDSWRDMEAGAAAGLPAQCFINNQKPLQPILHKSRIFHAESVQAVPALIPAIIEATKNASDV